MTGSEERLKYLLEQYAANESTEDEVKELFALIKRSGNDESVRSTLLQLVENSEMSPTYDMDRWEKVLQKVLKPGGREVIEMYPDKFVTLGRVAAAAVILLLLSIGGYFYFKQSTQKQIAKTEKQRPHIRNDIAAPQKNKAVLTLSDGSTIDLDSAGNGSLALQGNVKVVKLADGQIAYKGNATEVKYNTLAVPKGSKPVQLQLADGSEVWLNVASSITYPTAFVNNERKVQITGEAYFEVTHNVAMPFIVEKNDVSVQVLGTHFNVNTYDDETALRVTLFEGSVKVRKGNLASSLKPGQQAILPFDKTQGKQAQDDKEIKVVNADIDEVIAWKEGMFTFNGADIKTVMRQLARWYDVDIEYESYVVEKFHVEMSRNTNVSNVFKILETTGGVHFKIEGNKIKVMK